MTSVVFRERVIPVLVIIMVVTMISWVVDKPNYRSQLAVDKSLGIQTAELDGQEALIQIAVSPSSLVNESQPLPPLLSMPGETPYFSRLIRPDGAIAMTPNHYKIVPYFSNLSAMHMLDQPDKLELVGDYMDWYLRNLNRPDRWGLAGTIYDFMIYEDETRPSMDYDSADSYAATFLSLVNKYHEITGDDDYVKANYADLELVAQVLVTLQDSDGLIWVKPNYYVKFLMDNAENYRGLVDYALLLQRMGYNEESQTYMQYAVQVQEGIENVLWDSANQRYHWMVARNGRPQASRPMRWYPDGISQIYTVLFGLEEPSSPRATMLYDRLNENFPRWAQLDKGDGFPWALAAYTAAIMGDYGRAEEAVHNMYNRHIQPDDMRYWYNMEHAFYLRTKQLINTSRLMDEEVEGPEYGVPSGDEAVQRE